MMCSFAVALAIHCAQPRLSFREFYSLACFGDASSKSWPHWSGMRGESMEAVHKRVLDTVAAYSDYAADYRQQCPMEKK